MSIETRSNSALLKRAEQLKRWQESDTCRRCGDTRRGYKPKVQFTDGCVFLAACAASDKEEVRRLLARGADIDTANVDGLTALHQACIDDNLEMVEFLVERGADVNRGDNEGWTPLHATASCGFLSIAKYLLEHKCNVAAVNNDGELAIDISESDEMEELLQTEISSRSIDCEASRIVEERLMFEDAKKWVETDKFGDIPHQKTGATSLHVASAKGYIKVIGLLLECQAPISIQDYDGWTPLHAAAHWAQREAIELLCKNMADMDIKNYVGQTCFDVADPDVLKLLESLKREQATIQKEKPDIRNLVNRPSISSGGGKRRSSITRLSIDDKELRSKKDSSYERDSLRGSSLVSETIQESNKFNADSDVGRKNRANLSDVPKITLSKDESSSNKVPGYSPPHPPEDNKKKIASSPVETSPDEVHPWRRPLSLRSRPVSSSSTSSSSAVNNNNNKLQKDDNSSDSDVPLRRIHSFESDEKKRYDPDGANRVNKSDSLGSNSLAKGHQPPQSHVRRSFVPPVRDEESETQRKAHAKRVRETRRSTQGVTLEDLKSAEQLVKKKQQQENQIRTSELQQLAAAGVGSTATTTVTTSATLVAASGGGLSPASTTSSSTSSSSYERKPSWRIKTAEASSDKNKNLSGDAAGKGSSSSSKYLHPNNAQHQAGGYHNKSGGDKETHNGGEMDYKKLWEESQLENSRLREELSRSEDTRGRLEGALDSASKPQPISEAEKREKRALEKKLSEMEEELKQIEHLKNEIQRLRDENGALIRVISKLSK